MQMKGETTMALVTCGGCGLKFDRSKENAEFIKGRWYHPTCAKTKHDKMDLDAYICKVFGLKTPGPVNNSLLKKYRDNYGYSYEGMLKALKYFYEVKRQSIDKAEEKIGIIPHIYQDAQDYYFSFEKRKDKIAGSAIEENTVIEINLSKSQNTKKEASSNIDELNSLFGEE